MLVPYTQLAPLTHEHLERYARRNPALHVHYYELDPNDNDAYRRWLSHAWLLPYDFVIVEHDILPWPGALEELLGCPAAWCSNSYYLHNGYHLHHLLGCTKISRELRLALPAVWEKPVLWQACDGHLYHAARAIGFEPHPHRPPVIHLSRGQTENRVRPRMPVPGDR